MWKAPRILALAGAVAMASSSSQAFQWTSQDTSIAIAAGTIGLSMLDAEGVKQGVICEVNTVHVIAANAEACEHVGGKATHEIVTRAEEIKRSEAK